MPKYFVEGVYEESLQITMDVVVAVNEKAAEAEVTKVRQQQDENWKFDLADLLSERLKYTRKLMAASDKKTAAAWEQLKRDLHVVCEVCNEMLDDKDGDNWNGLCPGCADRVSEFMDRGHVERDRAVEVIRKRFLRAQKKAAA